MAIVKELSLERADRDLQEFETNVNIRLGPDGEIGKQIKEHTKKIMALEKQVKEYKVKIVELQIASEVDEKRITALEQRLDKIAEAKQKKNSS